MSDNKLNLKPFQVKDELNPNFFDKDGKFNSRIRLQLLDIVDDFIDTLEMDWIKPKDILLIGSIVNYNWNEYSDLDVNIVYNFNEIYPKNTEFVKDYFYAKRNDWNRKHEELLIKGAPVEITVVDENNMGVATGVYSLEKNEWVKKPKHLDNDNLDKEDIKKFCLSKIKEINNICDKIDTITDKHKLQKLNDELINIEDDLWDIRQDGLSSKDKEMSDGNIKYKVLKHMGYIDKLRDYQNKSYDKCNSIKESKIIVVTESQLNHLNEYYNNSVINYKTKDGKVLNYSTRKMYYLGSFLPIINDLCGTNFNKENLSDLHNILDNEYIKSQPNKNIQSHLNKKGYFVYNPYWMIRMLQWERIIRRLQIYDFGEDDYLEIFNNQNNNKQLPPNIFDEKDSYMPASYMENFINTDDTSELSEKIFK